MNFMLCSNNKMAEKIAINKANVVATGRKANQWTNKVSKVLIYN
jgi:hypothetical protein